MTLDRSPASSTLADAERSLKRRGPKGKFPGGEVKRLRECWSVRRAEAVSIRRRIVAALCALLAASVAFHVQATVDSRDRSSIPVGEEPITPVPRAASLDADKVRLGEMLFHDVRLSRNDVLACTSCHLLAQGGDDNRSRSPGSDGEPLNFNAPTVFNAAMSFRLNWRGNFRSLEEQNEAVLLDPRLMNTSWQELLPKLRADEAYREAFTTSTGATPRRHTCWMPLRPFSAR